MTGGFAVTFLTTAAPRWKFRSALKMRDILHNVDIGNDMQRTRWRVFHSCNFTSGARSVRNFNAWICTVGTRTSPTYAKSC
jgi:hypothetical protein